jgi:surface polysaccharide O-acyltransferase-like enzyme
MDRDSGLLASDSRTVSLDLLKVVMALMVVGLHANFMREHSETVWWYSVKGLFRIAVPVFLVSNGYFFAMKSPTGDWRWLRRIVYFYIVWTAIYAPVWLPTNRSVSRLAMLLTFGWFHLWYLAGLIGATFCLLLLRRLGTRFLVAAMVGCLFAGVALQYGAFETSHSSLVGRVLRWNSSHRNFLLFSFPFFTAGYLIQKHELGTRFGTAASGTICLVGLLLLFVEAHAVHALTGGEGDVDNLLSLGLLAPAVFLTAMKVPLERCWGKQVSRLANGIYFTHPIFLVGLGFERLLAPTLATAATAAASIALTAMIMAFPPLSKRLL